MLEQADAGAHHPLDRHRTLPGVAEAHREVGAHVHVGRDSALHRGGEHRELVLVGAVEVALGEALRRAAEDRDVLQPGLDRAVEPALVGHQHRHRHRAVVVDPCDQLLGVGELRHPARVHEARGLHDGEPGRDQAMDELHLDVERHDLGLVLQTVARPHLVDRHPLRQRAVPVGRRHHHRQPEVPRHASTLGRVERVVSTSSTDGARRRGPVRWLRCEVLATSSKLVTTASSGCETARGARPTGSSTDRQSISWNHPASRHSPSSRPASFITPMFSKPIRRWSFSLPLLGIVISAIAVCMSSSRRRCSRSS